MSATITNDTISRTASAALSQHRLVRVNSSGQLAVCGVGQSPRGVTTKESASGDLASATLIASDKTLRMTASAAISRGALVFAAASGKISSTAAGAPIGVALEAATGDGSIIEVAPLRQQPFVLQGTAGGSGTIDLTHSLGANPLVCGLLIRTAAGAVRQVITASTCTITFPDTNTVRVAHADIVATDIVSILCQPTN